MVTTGEILCHNYARLRYDAVAVETAVHVRVKLVTKGPYYDY